MGERRERAAVWIAIGLIAVHALLLGWSALRNSVMFDEAAHLAAGCSYVRYREFSVYNYNPPLVQMLAAWPVVLAKADVPNPQPFRDDAPASRIWLFSMAFEHANRTDYQHLFVMGRLALLPVSCLGAWLVFAWGRRLYGSSIPALAACAMWVFEPDVLAHGSIVGADLAIAVAMMGALLAWSRFCERATPGRAFAAGVVIGVAHLCKLTALLLWPAMAVLGIATLIRNRRIWRELLTGYTLCIILTFVLVNLCYGYNRSFERLAKFDFRSRQMQAIQQHFGWMPAPLPRQLMLGIDSLKWELQARFQGYLLGKTYMGAQWNYYPVALACKLPVSILLLFALTIVSMFWPGRGRLTRKAPEWPVLLALLTLTAGMAMPDLNLGVRYLLPLYPLAILLVARLWTLGRGIRLVGWGLIVLLAVECFSVAPRYLTFYNAFAGGPQRGWKIVNAGSDWGQGLLDLKRWQDEHHAGPIELAYFGMVDPQTYGIDYVPFGEGSGEPYVAISSYFLVGQEQRSRSTHGPPRWVHVDGWQQLLQMKPVAVPSGTIFIFTRKQLETANQ